MSFEWLCVIFFVMTVLNYIFLDIKVDKIKKERSLDRDKVIGSLIAHNQALRRLNTLFRGHERRINDIENLLLLSKKPEEPEHTCNDCKYHHPLNGIGFADAVNYFECEKIKGCYYPIECNKACQAFEKKESLDEDENVFYANNVKVDIPSKAYIYTTNGILTSEELVDRIRKLYLDGGISYVDADSLLERLKQ